MKRVTVTLREDVIQKVMAYADRRGLSFSAAIRCIVADAQDMGLIPTPKPQDDDVDE